LREYDPQLHCVIQLTEELALQQARQADQEIQAGKYRGPLHGIPYGVKDLLATKHYNTTWGAQPYKAQYIDEDAAVVKKMREAGAVLVAKLTLGALAMGDVWYGGKTRNPWNLDQGSSGSSAGSASAVSAGLLPFAIGTETLGSIVSPSTRCGTTGLRPTFGRVSRTQAMALSWTMDKIGPICRSVEDCALVFRYLHGPDGQDLRVVDVPFHYDAQMDPKKLKIAYVKDAFEGDYGFKKQDQAVLDKFREMGVELVPIELPQLPEISFILMVEAAAAFDQLTLTNQDDELVRQYKNAWPNLFRQARFVPAVEYVQANRLRTLLMQEMEKLMSKVDVFISPSFRGNTLRITNLTGHPCVVLPNGFTQNNSPTSITFIGQLFEEGKLLRVAQAFQEATGFHRKHPNLKP
ncbi:MAG: amidase, partial [Bacteroidota bacterium]